MSSIHRVVVAVLVLMVAMTARAQDVATGWDRSDPINKTELRIYLATAYQFEQAGQVWPDSDLFWFTNTPPDHRMVMLAPAFEVFGELYKHRLDPWGEVGPPSSLADLMRDDPAVASKFRHYTLTGEFITSTDDDPEVLAKHLAMAVEAITESEECQGDAITVVIMNGLYYLIDPYTGQTHGPYSTMKDANDAAIAIAHQFGMLCQGWKPSGPPLTWPPGQHPSPNEPKPWWDYKDMQDRFCEKLRQCCNEIPTWYTPPANCTPTTLPDGSTPSNPSSPCDKIKPYMPPGTFVDPNVVCR